MGGARSAQRARAAWEVGPRQAVLRTRSLVLGGPGSEPAALAGSVLPDSAPQPARPDLSHPLTHRRTLGWRGVRAAHPHARQQCCLPAGLAQVSAAAAAAGRSLGLRCRRLGGPGGLLGEWLGVWT